MCAHCNSDRHDTANHPVINFGDKSGKSPCYCDSAYHPQGH